MSTTAPATATESELNLGVLPAAEVRNCVTLPLQLEAGLVTRTQLVTFCGLVDDREHLAVVFGDALDRATPLVRLHSECLTGDVLLSARCDCGPQLRECLTTMRSSGGILLYLRQEGRGIGLYNKVDAYGLQDLGLDTYEANRVLDFDEDLRTYRVAAQMLLALGVRSIELMSNNPDKSLQLHEAGVTVAATRPTAVHATTANLAYLRAKARHGHLLQIQQEQA